MDDGMVVVPAYNAASTLGTVLAAIPPGYRAVVVDEGSTDRTGEVARAHGAAVLRHEVNRGKGAAIRTALVWAQGEGLHWIITLDADGQHDPREISRFPAAYHASDVAIVVGNRYAVLNGTGDQSPWLRRWSNQASSRLIRRVARVPLADIQCGFRLYAVDPVMRLPTREPRFAWETEVLVWAVRFGYPVTSVPVQCLYPDGTRTSHYQGVRDSWCIARAVIRARWGRP